MKSVIFLHNVKNPTRQEMAVLWYHYTLRGKQNYWMSIASTEVSLYGIVESLTSESKLKAIDTYKQKSEY